MINTTFKVEPIKPAKLVDEKISKLYRSLIKIGFGTLTTPYGEIWYNNLRSKSLLFGAHFNHFSSVGQIKGYGNSSFSDNDLDVYAGKYLKNMSVTGGLGYSRNVVHYYGFKPADFPLDTINKRRYQAALFVDFRECKTTEHQFGFIQNCIFSRIKLLQSE